MKIAKCDICGKAAVEYFQVKFRKVTTYGPGATKCIDLCEKCFSKTLKAAGQKKDVSQVS